MQGSSYKTDVAIIGGGLAGIVAAIELLEKNKQVVLVDRDIEANFGGLAKESFGGMFFVDTPHQRRTGIKDSTELALKDWHSFAEFPGNSKWPVSWAEQYVNLCTDEVYAWLRKLGIRFFPIVHWVERGMDRPGNSVPRFHMVWGTGYGLIKTLVRRLKGHKNAANLTTLFQHHITDFLITNGRIEGIRGIMEPGNNPFEIKAEFVIVAAGGISGNIEKVKANWYKPWGEPPDIILNGSHQFADGEMHDLIHSKLNGHIANLDKMWAYAAGVHHHKPKRPNHGLSLIPPRSALWFNFEGIRFEPPLVSGFDTRYLVEQVCRQEKKYSWQVLNMKIAIKELAVSGSEYNKAIRNKSVIGFLRSTLFGNRSLVKEFLSENKDFIVAKDLRELAGKMNELAGSSHVDAELLARSIAAYDAQIEEDGDDEQISKIEYVRQYRGDRVRTCKFQKINDPKALPFIAIREFILSRKSLGGIETDLECRVLSDNGPIAGLYCVGEAAGFGGGGMHGLRSLEGTFLGGCVLNGRLAARSIAKG